MNRASDVNPHCVTQPLTCCTAMVRRAPVSARIGMLAWGLALTGAGMSSGHAEAPREISRLVFACEALHLPTQEAVAHLTGTHNAGQTYRARERLLQGVRSACLRGAAQVLVEAESHVETRTASASHEPR
jgi:hypothetical protein